MVMLYAQLAGTHSRREFLEKGEPINFAVPERQGAIVSGLRLRDRVLVHRTDFDAAGESVMIAVDGRTLNVPRVQGECRILQIPAT